MLFDIEKCNRLFTYDEDGDGDGDSTISASHCRRVVFHSIENASMRREKKIIHFSFFIHLIDIEAQIQEIQNKKKELAQTSSDKGVGLLESGYFDSELYDDGTNKKSRYEGYMTSIAANDDIDDDDDEGLPIQQKRVSYTAPKAVLKDIVKQVNARRMHHDTICAPMVRHCGSMLKIDISCSETGWKRRLRSICRKSSANDCRERGWIPSKKTSPGHFTGACGSICRWFVYFAYYTRDTTFLVAFKFNS